MANGRDRNGNGNDTDGDGAPSADDTVWDAQAWASASPSADRQHRKREPELWRPDEAEPVSPPRPLVGERTPARRSPPWGRIALGLALAVLIVRRALRRRAAD